MSKELDLFGESKKTMTVKEVAEIMQCDDETVRRHIRKLYPDFFENGKKSYLNEEMVTQVKIGIERSGRNDLRNVAELPKTDLEKEMLIFQAMKFQNEKIIKLQEQLAIAGPKIEAYETLIKTDTMMSISNACKHFGVQPIKHGIPSLIYHGYLTTKNLPTQRAIDLDIMKLKEAVGNDKRTHLQAVVESRQLVKFGKILERITKE